MDYRKDIDGLRAIAVLPVIFYHAGFASFNGGFLGVDVFFVISGFLITTILLDELNNQNFSIVNFYERRARRILPALFLVLFVTSLVAYIFMSPLEFREYAQSLVSVVAFMSNVFFYLEIDYFSLAAEEMPLLHTWSLAIEEQYYLFFPPLLYVVWKYLKRLILPLFVALFFVSIAHMLWLNHYDNPSASFYWIFPRAWELMAGSLCAYWRNQKENSGILANIGFSVLLVCILGWSKELPHPSIFTTLPVLGTCLIILYSHKGCLTYKVLSHKSLVSIGLISYSLYLWHQPIFAFIAMKSIGKPNSITILFGLFNTLLLAWVTYKYVETPYRNRRKFNRKFILSSSAVMLTVFACAGLYGHFMGGLPDRYESIISYDDTMKPSPKRDTCHSSDKNYIAPLDACSYFKGNISWASFGDSHIVEPTFALAELLDDKGMGIRHHSYSGCPPALNYKINGNELCSQWLNDTLSYLENDTSITHVLLGFRYSYGIYGENLDVYPKVSNNVNLNIINIKSLSENEKLEIYWRSLNEIIDRLLKSNKTIWLLDPIPELPLHISKAVKPFSIFGERSILDLNVSTPKEYYFERHAFILERLKTLAYNDKLIRIPVYDLLCNELGCPAVAENSALYFDDDHLSVEGSRILFDRFSHTLEVSDHYEAYFKVGEQTVKYHGG
jgi:peptidoglycan/LPS O-acetylase OafA/YrhL